MLSAAAGQSSCILAGKGELEVVGTALVEGKKSREKPLCFGLKSNGFRLRFFPETNPLSPGRVGLGVEHSKEACMEVPCHWSHGTRCRVPTAVQLRILPKV